jgi:hypothetical protein
VSWGNAVSHMITYFVTMVMILVMGGSSSYSQIISPPIPIPPEQFGQYCYFNSGNYSPGAIFCAKGGMSIECIGPHDQECIGPHDQEGKQLPATWRQITPDNACQAPTPLSK